MIRSHPTPSIPQRAFTLLELIVALVIAAAAAAATTLILSNIVRSRDAAASRSQAFSRAGSAANFIAQDVLNLVHDSDTYFTRLRLQSGSAGVSHDVGERDELLIISRVSRPTRLSQDQPESDEAEVQYRITDSLSASTPDLPSPALIPTLWRRVDACPDDFQDGGGVATPLIDNVLSLSIQAADSDNVWHDDWDSDYDGFPYALRITITAQDSSQRSQRTARRIIALDRTPLPGRSVVDELAESSSAGSSTSAPSSGSGSSGSSSRGSDNSPGNRPPGSGDSGNGGSNGGPRPGPRPGPGGGGGGVGGGTGGGPGGRGNGGSPGGGHTP